MKGFLMCFAFLVSYSFAQNSYEFKSAVPPEAQIVQTIDAQFFGEYLNEKTGTKYIVNKEGLSMETVIVSFITKEQVRESSKFDVRNGYLFGVVENDSVPCVFEEDKYFFGVKQKITFNDSKHKAIIKKVSDQSYILNFTETSGYSPSMIQFKNNTLSISHFTYPSETTVFDGVSKSEKTKGQDYNLVLLDPNLKEWNNLDKSVIFDAEIVFTKQ